MTPAIEVAGLRKSYGAREALRGISLEVATGEIFALLGPNGAGKTTTVEILAGYRRPDAGRVRVLGAEPADAGPAHRARVGIVLQGSGVYPYMSPREVLTLFAGYYPRPRPVIEVLAAVGLEPSADTRVRLLSGGQRRRLDVALGLIGDPEVIFLDEPTTGFDPEARRACWDVVAGLAAGGTTVFLTTHYMDEARALAGRVAVLRDGEVVAMGRPQELVADLGTAEIGFDLDPAHDVALSEVVGAPVRRSGRRVSVQTATPTATVHAVSGWALERGLELVRLEVLRPSLEDVYLSLTSVGDVALEGPDGAGVAAGGGLGSAVAQRLVERAVAE
jgi:ABC-2 type transport system ATP-binding protein